MKSLIFILILSGCCQTKYIYKTPEFDMPKKPVIQKTEQTQSDGQKARIIEENLLNLESYSTKLEKTLSAIKGK